MVKVHVWLPDANHIGHTALTVKDRYISFWPDGDAGKKDLKLKRSQPGMLLQSLREDIRNEGGRQPITIELPRLDAERILIYLANLEGNLPRYQIARNNCSHIVAKALIEGAKCKPSFKPNAGYYSKLGKVLGYGIWTPDQVLRFAEELHEA
jgi:hypothetical protein